MLIFQSVNIKIKAIAYVTFVRCFCFCLFSKCDLFTTSQPEIKLIKHLYLEKNVYISHLFKFLLTTYVKTRVTVGGNTFFTLSDSC